MKNKKFIILGLFVFVLVGCQTAPVREVQIRDTREIQMGQKAESVQLVKLAIELKRGKVIGDFSTGLLCVKHGDLTWEGSRVSLSSDDFIDRVDLSSDDFTDVFRDELENAGFEVVGDPNAPFGDASDNKAQYLIGGLINDIEANMCYPHTSFGDLVSSKGNAYLKASWQIYSALSGEVVYQVDTEGVFQRKDIASAGNDDIFINAFGVATQNLLADEGFYNLVTGDGPVLKGNAE